MRPRTFILLILVLLAAAALVVLFVTRNSGGVAGVTSGTGDGSGTAATTAEPNLPAPTATPSVRLEPVVVAKVRLPVGEMLTPDILAVEMRPNTNVALQGGYTFTDTNRLIGRIVKVEVARGQALLTPMIALNPTDISAFGSDLALYVPFGEVAIAFPVDRFTGASLAMRPGDQVDVLMTLRTVEIDPEFRSALPNTIKRVIQSQLLAGKEFLFPPVTQGRLEFIPEINQVAAIVPNSTNSVPGQDFAVGAPIPKRVTQLTIQQTNVLYVGTWNDPRTLEREQEAARAAAEAAAAASVQSGGSTVVVATPRPIPSRLETNPDMVILSMSAQDALALKYARERGVEIVLVLRSPGDNTVFVTTSVSLPQIIDQGGLALPEQSDFDLFTPGQ